MRGSHWENAVVHHRLRPVVFALVCLALACPVAAADSPTRRSGRVRLEGRSLADDGGKFNALGASLFYGAWAYRHDRPRLERNLKTLSRSGFCFSFLEFGFFFRRALLGVAFISRSPGGAYD